MIEGLLETIKPPLRAMKYQWLWQSAKYKATYLPSAKYSQHKPIAFIIGCGRSGTTFLGNILADHPQVSYFFEPYHLWTAIDLCCDVLNLFQSVTPSLLMDSYHITEVSKRRFDSLFLDGADSNKNKSIVIEKTPLNALRIGYLEALASGAKYVHLVRDGVEVSQSIAKLAETNSYKITGKPLLNQWWGVDFAKWKAVKRDGKAAGYFPEEVDLLEDSLSMASYEWLVSLSEIDRWRDSLGNRLLEINYSQFTAHPKKQLATLSEFLELEPIPEWLEKGVSQVKKRENRSNAFIPLPKRMCETFNSYQERYGFVGRAVVQSYSHT